MPILTFLFEDIGKIIGDKLEKNDTGRRLVDEFRNKLTNANRLVKFYSSIDDLKSKITSAMHQAIIDTPAIGWIRADKVDVTQENLIEGINQAAKAIPIMNEIQHLNGKGYNKFELSKDAIILLMKISQDSSGEVLVLNTVTGTYFNTNGENLNEDGFGKEVAIWESAIDELVNSGLAKSQKISGRDEVVRLTKQGYDVVEMLNL